MTQPNPDRPTFALPPQSRRQRIQLPANGLQKAAPIIALVGLGTPLYWLLVHGLSGHGWGTFMYFFFVAINVFISQVLLLIPVIMRARMTDPAAGGPISTPLALAAIILHTINGLFVGDAGDAPDSGSLPWVTRTLGMSESVASYLWIGLSGLWILTQLAAIIMAFVESSRTRLEREAQKISPQAS